VIKSAMSLLLIVLVMSISDVWSIPMNFWLTCSSIVSAGGSWHWLAYRWSLMCHRDLKWNLNSLPLS
jgi:hypothetical protein